MTLPATDDAGKMGITPVIADGSEEEDLVSFLIEEEMVKEVMKKLEYEISASSSSSLDSSYFSSPSFSPFPSFITINGNEESCGPSFSDSASSVMASFSVGSDFSIAYFMGPSPTDFYGEKTAVRVPENGPVGGFCGAEEGGSWLWPVPEVDRLAGDGEEIDDEWLSAVFDEQAFGIEG